MASWKLHFGGLCPLLSLSLAGCATVDPGPDYEKAREEIHATTGVESIYHPEGPALSAEEIQLMVSDGLGLDEAARLALLNNRRLQAGFMGLGVARAEYVQAGLLSNPSLSLAFLFPEGGGRVKWTADLVGSVADLWQIPSRKAVAAAGLEQRILEVSRFAGELVAATRAAYFESVAAGAERSVARESVELARRLLEAVRRQAEHGVATRTEENLAESLSLGAELSLRRAEREEVTAKRRLAALLSLEADVFEVELADPLPEPALLELERESLVDRSLEVRPDVRAAGKAVAAAEGQADLERRRIIPELSAGLSAERPEGGSSTDFLIGPTATIEIPLFDQNQAQVSRAEFHLAELRMEYAALVAEVSQEVRAKADKAASAARAATFVQEDLLPQAEQSAALAKKAYELGDTTVLALLEAQRTVLEARRTLVDALLEAARSRIELERAVGAPLGAATGAKAP
ncbi:MAG: TolC family protein [Planctomycetota bacterium]|nr:MAG: TolC family protein [Planctomycetota bacterium]